MASLWVVYLLWKMSNSIWPSLLAAIFPPAWIKVAAKAATEPIFMAFGLTGVYLFMKKRFFLTGLLIGISFIIRPIGLMLLLACLLMIRKDLIGAVKMISGFGITASVLFIFNGMAFGWNNMPDQFMHTDRYGMRFGLGQMISDIFRTISWGQFRTLFSGIFYVALTAIILIVLLKKAGKSFLDRLFLIWAGLSLLYILAISPSRLLDDFGRYTLAFLPATLFGLTYIIERLLAAMLFNLKRTDKIKTWKSH
jgi:hypothetical protein